MPAQEKFCVSPVKLNRLPAAPSGELSEEVFRKCLFCEKDCLVIPVTLHFSEKIAGPGRYFCPFCLRNGLHTKNSRNMLILSFRAIIGHFYYQNYQLATAGKRMYLSDIEDYIRAHEETGLLNPVFGYDPETFLWHVDFNRVGSSKKKLPVEDVLKTVVDILACFNLTENVPGVNTANLYAKFKQAIDNFYTHRHRPPDKRMLIPTLAGCVPNAHFDKLGVDRLRTFTVCEMEVKK